MPDEIKKPVLAIFSYKQPIVFESVTEVIEYFREIGHPLANAKAVVRRINNNENWSYTEICYDGSVRKVRVVEVWFDWYTEKPVSRKDPDTEWKPRYSEDDK